MHTCPGMTNVMIDCDTHGRENEWVVIIRTIDFQESLLDILSTSTTMHFHFELQCSNRRLFFFLNFKIKDKKEVSEG